MSGTTGRFAGALVSICTFAAIASAQNQRVVRGVVMDVSDHPVPAARLQLAGRSVAVTDDSGRFRVEIPNRDRAMFDVTRIGFMPSRFGIVEGGDTTVSILLLPTARELPKVEVKSAEVDPALDRTGFLRRLADKERGTNTGIFITAADIDRRKPTRITSMFEDLPNVRVCRKSTIETCGLWGTHLVPDQLGRKLVPCPITVYLDGQRLNSLKETDVGVDIDAIVLPSSVAGVEYYPSGNRIPTQFSLLNGSCGAVIIWTKRG